MSREVVLAGAVRTAIGKFGGTLAGVPASELGSVVIKEALKRAGVDAHAVDEVLMGCVLQAGLGQNVARQASLKAGIPIEVPATTINNVCGSGLKCVNMAAALIRSGEADIVVAGGMENMSSAPYLLPNARYGYRMNNGTLVDSMINDGLWDAFNDYHMGITAENIAEKYEISREMQDEFAALSQQRCESAMKDGRFREEIVPVIIKTKKGDMVFDTDEYPRPGVTAEGISRLKPAFKNNGTVTAANASGINDGAAAVIVMSGEKAKELGVTPLVRFVVGSSAGVEPSHMGLGAAAAAEKAMKQAGLSVDDIDLFEANEAFAAQAIACNRILGLNPEKVNVNGGAIALGHPIGASGCRILVTLLYEMKRRGLGLGLATLCVGGGMGAAAIVENIR